MFIFRLFISQMAATTRAVRLKLDAKNSIQVSYVGEGVKYLDDLPRHISTEQDRK